MTLVVQAIQISIHALRGEGDVLMTVAPRFSQLFLSTPSVGRATVEHIRHRMNYEISIHALRGEGDPWTASRQTSKKISIHALRGEGDALPPAAAPAW